MKDDGVVDPAELDKAVHLIDGWRYGRPARYPEPLPGVRVAQAPPQHTSCCTAVEAILLHAAVASGWESTWHPGLHARACLTSERYLPWGPPIAYQMAGLARMEPANAQLQPDERYVVQGWQTGAWTGGHTWLVWGYDPPSDRVLVLEANRPPEVEHDGLAYRGLGLASDGVPDTWWEDDRCPTWSDVLEGRPHVRWARIA